MKNVQSTLKHHDIELILGNEFGERLNCGKPYSVKPKSDKNVMRWEIPPYKQTSPFTFAILHDGTNVIGAEFISPTRFGREKYVEMVG